ncbi:MAG: bifunctional folylpolyglutamate synthase/dihydrofolate synthase [Kiritimatiellae bacterium]|nr:bifunctional folylpolyglutamate synthase/dihydrofolate synthase [Kiritimatiellia bacterium]MDW8458295.1 folylpolyglutamate synthase/dihydrofolate synthase family protein [Verrucomicrobiota bacterium]
MAHPEKLPLSDVLERLYRRNLHVIKLGLEPMRRLARELGDPHLAFPNVHVAGTNGKGSVCAIAASIFRAAGLRTGLYTSPHLERFHERIQVDGAPIGDAELSDGIDAVEAAAARVREDGERDVTFFEFTTGLAFRHFQRAGVQLAVIETGMGGRLDATNIVEPLACAITTIGFDHQKWLGDTLEKIAAEKAGIIKSSRPVVVGHLLPAADEVIERVARERRAHLVRASDVCSVERISQSVEWQDVRVETAGGLSVRARCPLIGRHQLANISIAVAMSEIALEQLGRPLSGAVLRAGLQEVVWPARAQLIERDPTTILDGAHNPQAMEALRRTIDEVRGDRPIGLVAGFLEDKDAVQCLAAWRGAAQKVWLVRLEDARAMESGELERAAVLAGIVNSEPPRPLDEAWDLARAWCREQGALLVITGSLHLAGAVLAHLRSSRQRGRSC